MSGPPGDGVRGCVNHFLLRDKPALFESTGDEAAVGRRHPTTGQCVSGDPQQRRPGRQDTSCPRSDLHGDSTEVSALTKKEKKCFSDDRGQGCGRVG